MRIRGVGGFCIGWHVVSGPGSHLLELVSSEHDGQLAPPLHPQTAAIGLVRFSLRLNLLAFASTFPSPPTGLTWALGRLARVRSRRVLKHLFRAPLTALPKCPPSGG